MPKKIKKEKIEETETPIMCFEDLKKYLQSKELNPLEKMMGIELLLHGFNFFVQYNIKLPDEWVVNGRKKFIADFFIPELNLIIETDGKIHFKEELQIKDRNKNNVLTALGYRVFHFDWNEVMKSSGNWDIFHLISELAFYINNEINV